MSALLGIALLIIIVITWGAYEVVRHHRRRHRHHRRHRISLLVPFRTDDGPRAANWQWLRQYWEAQLPEAEIILATDDGTPFCKTAAVNRAFRRSRGDIIVILDADCYLRAETVRWCAAEIRTARGEGHPLWFLPYRRFYRLSAYATHEVLGSQPTHPKRFGDPPLPGQTEPGGSHSAGHHWAALVQIMPYEAFVAAGGMDENFRGWGGEDVSFMLAVDRLYGHHRTFNGPVYHLWHPTIKGTQRSPRQWEGQDGPEPNVQRAMRYRRASGEREAMQALVDEHRTL